MADQFDVLMFALPEVSEAEESILGPACQTKRFDSLDSARQFAEQNKTTYNRITINVASTENPTLLERYVDGTRIEFEQDQSAQDVSTSAPPETAAAPTGPAVTETVTPAK